ncbi:hypothetical protein, partial [Metallibacterium sp.]
MREPFPTITLAQQTSESTMRTGTILVPLAATLLFMTAARAASPHPSAVLPSGRVVTPAGQLAATPNFPVAVTVQDGAVAVIDGGANKRQSLRLYASSDLRALTAIDTLLGGARAQDAPGAVVAQGAQGGERPVPATASIPDQSLFQGLAAAPDGTLYATGGNSDNLLALRHAAGKLELVRRYA